jgi:hypothetical protein
MLTPEEHESMERIRNQMDLEDVEFKMKHIRRHWWEFWKAANELELISTYKWILYKYCQHARHQYYFELQYKLVRGRLDANH